MRVSDPRLSVIPSFQYRAKLRLAHLSGLLVALQLTESWDNQQVQSLLDEARYLRHGLSTMLNPGDLTLDEQRFICERLLPSVAESGVAFVEPAPIDPDPTPVQTPLSLTLAALRKKIRGVVDGPLTVSGAIGGTVPNGTELLVLRDGQVVSRTNAVTGIYRVVDNTPGRNYTVMLTNTQLQRQAVREVVSSILYGSLPHGATNTQLIGLAVAPAITNGRLRLDYVGTRNRMYLLVPTSAGGVLSIKQPSDNDSDISAGFTHTTQVLDFGVEGTDSYDVIEHYANMVGPFTLEAYFSNVVVVPPVP